MKDRSAGRSVLVSVLVTEKRDLWMNKIDDKNIWSKNVLCWCLIEKILIRKLGRDGGGDDDDNGNNSKEI